MGMFDSKRREIDAERKGVMGMPSPAGFVRLVERYAAINELDAAGEIARDGMKRFPDSEKIQQAYQNVRRIQLQGDIQDLHKKIQDGRAGANEFDRLARIYFQELGNKTKAYEIAFEGLDRYKKASGLNMLCGQIRMERYFEDHLANDWTEARAHLEKTSELNPSATMARVYLAQLFVAVGLYSRAKPIVEQLQAEASTENVENLARQIASAPAEDASVDLETRLSRISKGLAPEAGDEAEEALAAEPIHVSVETRVLEAYLSRVEKIDGFKAAAVVAAGGEALAVKSTVPELEAAFAELVHSVYSASEEAANRMDIGSFVNGEIDTPRGTLSISESGGLVLGILAGAPAKMELLRKAAEEFVSVTRSA